MEIPSGASGCDRGCGVLRLVLADARTALRMTRFPTFMVKKSPLLAKKVRNRAPRAVVEIPIEVCGCDCRRGVLRLALADARTALRMTSVPGFAARKYPLLAKWARNGAPSRGSLAAQC